MSVATWAGRSEGGWWADGRSSLALVCRSQQRLFEGEVVGTWTRVLMCETRGCAGEVQNSSPAAHTAQGLGSQMWNICQFYKNFLTFMVYGVFVEWCILYVENSTQTGHLSTCWSAVNTQDTCLPTGAQSSHRTPVCLLERSHHTGHVSACLRNSEKPNWSNWPLQKNRLCLETTDIRTGCGMMMNQRHTHLSKSKSVGLKFGKCRTVHRQYESFPTIGRAKFIQTHRSTWCSVVAARFVTK
jgi:hypothetical protein